MQKRVCRWKIKLPTYQFEMLNSVSFRKFISAFSLNRWSEQIEHMLRATKKFKCQTITATRSIAGLALPWPSGQRICNCNGLNGMRTCGAAIGSESEYYSKHFVRTHVHRGRFLSPHPQHQQKSPNDETSRQEKSTHDRNLQQTFYIWFGASHCVRPVPHLFYLNKRPAGTFLFCVTYRNKNHAHIIKGNIDAKTHIYGVRHRHLAPVPVSDSACCHDTTGTAFWR